MEWIFGAKNRSGMVPVQQVFDGLRCKTPLRHQGFWTEFHENGKGIELYVAVWNKRNSFQPKMI